MARPKGIPAWNKGLKTGLVPKTAFKKGHIPWQTGTKGLKPAPSTAFKKGQKNPSEWYKGRVAWNKGKKGIMPIPWNKGIDNRPFCSVCNSKIKGYQAKMCRHCIHKDKTYLKKVLGKRKMSSLEIRVNNVIHKYNLPYKFVGNGKFFIGKKNPDFVNTNGQKIAIEVYCRRQKELVREVNVEDWKNNRRKLFAEYGWKTIFIEDWQTNSEYGIIQLMRGDY